MLTIILFWIFLFAITFFIGKLFLNAKLLGLLRLKADLEWYEYFWAGLFAVFAILQIWSIFLPLNIYSLIFIALLGVVSAVIHRKDIRIPRLSLKFWIYTGLILLFISYFASLPVGWEDTYLYHLGMVKWGTLYKIVPGLANLHDRFGLNSSLFQFAAMIDNWIMQGRSSHIALSFITSVLSIEFLWIFLKQQGKLIKIFGLLVLPVFAVGITKITWSGSLNSLSPDYALTIFALAISFEVLAEKKGSLLIAGLLSLLLITIKFSSLFFAGMVLLLVLFELRTLVFFIASGIVMLAPFIARNIILSGWPLYPLPLFRVNVPWAVPKDKVVDLYNVIKAWAISPGAGWTKSVGLPFWQWFPGWFSRRYSESEMTIFSFGILLSFFAPITGIVTSGFLRKYRNLLLLGGAALVSTLYMLYTAPDIRFGQVFFWIFFASIAALYFEAILENSRNLKILFIFGILHFAFGFMWPIRIESEPILKSVRWEVSYPTVEAIIKPKDGSPSFTVRKPTDDNLCGNAPLPCTPYTDTGFKEIVPGDISKGFAPVK